MPKTKTRLEKITVPTDTSHLGDASPMSDFTEVTGGPRRTAPHSERGFESLAEDGSEADEQMDYESASDFSDADDLELGDDVRLYLGPSHCRALTKVTVSKKGGPKVACICGRMTVGCANHSERRAQNRQPEGFYKKIEDSRGNHHGTLGSLRTFPHASGPPTSAGELDTRYDDDLPDPMSDEERDQEIDDLRAKLEAANLEFDPPRKPRAKPAASDPEEPEMQSTSDVTDSKKVSFGRERTPPTLVVGMFDLEGRPTILNHQDEVNSRLSSGWRLHRFFDTLREGLDWKKRATRSNKDSKPKPSSTNSTGPPSNDQLLADLTAKIDLLMQSSPTSNQKPSEPKSTQESTDSDPETSDDSSISSGSSSSSPSSGSSSEDSSERRSRRRRAARKKKKASKKARKAAVSSKRRRRRRKSEARKADRAAAPALRDKVLGKYKDDCVGDKDHAFGVPVNEEGVDLVIGPEELSRKDAELLYDLAIDVSSLPGTFRGSTGDDVGFGEGNTELVASILQAHGKRETLQPTSLFRSEKRHGLRHVTDAQGLFNLSRKVEQGQQLEFKNQDSRFRKFLSRRQFSSEEISEWLEKGFLPKIVRLTYQYYHALLNEARSKLFTGQMLWEGSSAKTIIQHHAEKLLDIRLGADSKKMLFWDTYIYLRDANEKGFFTSKLTENLFDELQTLRTQFALSTPPATPTKPSAGPSKERDPKKPPTTCPSCKNKALHDLFKVDLQTRNCPLNNRGLTFPARKKAASVVVEKRKEDPSADLKDLLDAAVSSNNTSN